MFLYVRFPAARTKGLGVRRSWRAGADCKSVGLSLRWFESTHSHQNTNRLSRSVFVLCCGIRIRAYNRQIVGFGTSTKCAVKGARRKSICVGNYNPPTPTTIKKTPPCAVFFFIVEVIYYSSISTLSMYVRFTDSNDTG